MRLEAIAGGLVRVAGEAVAIEQPQPIVDAVARQRRHCYAICLYQSSCVSCGSSG